MNKKDRWYQQTTSFSNHDAVCCFTVFTAVDAVFQIKSAILRCLIILFNVYLLRVYLNDRRRQYARFRQAILIAPVFALTVPIGRTFPYCIFAAVVQCGKRVYPCSEQLQFYGVIARGKIVDLLFIRREGEHAAVDAVDSYADERAAVAACAKMHIALAVKRYLRFIRVTSQSKRNGKATYSSS